MMSRTKMTCSHIARSLPIVPLLLLMACADGGTDGTGEKEAIDVESMSREERIELRQKMQGDKIPTSTFVAGEQSAVTGEVPDEILDAIFADLENLTTADRSEFEVVQGQAMQFGSGALGCPEPGQMYTQAIVDGFRVVVVHAGKRYDYRAKADGYFRLCPGFEPPNR